MWLGRGWPVGDDLRGFFEGEIGPGVGLLVGWCVDEEHFEGEGAGIGVGGGPGVVGGVEFEAKWAEEARPGVVISWCGCLAFENWFPGRF